MKITLDIATLGARPGDTIDLPRADAQALLDGGHAHHPAPATDPEPRTEPVDTKPKHGKTDPTPES